MAYRKRKRPKSNRIPEESPENQTQKNDKGIFTAQSATDIVVDDESYFTFSGAHMPENRGFSGGAGDAVSYRVSIAPKGKFPKKPLVWIAISPRG